MEPRWRPALAHLTPYDAGPPLERLEAELGRPVVRLSANENPLGPSPLALQAIRAEAERVHLYPDGGAVALREALATALGVTPGAILLGNGADELIGLLVRALVDPGDEVVIPRPAFEPYESAARQMGGAVVWSPLHDYRIDLEDLAGRVTPRTKLVFVGSPHNPTGTVVGRAAWEAFLGALPGEVVVLLDEAYRDFVETDDCPDGLEALARRPTLVVLRTFSKIAGLAGLRIGYAVGAPRVIETLGRLREPFNVNRLAQAAARAALGDVAHRERTRALVFEERRFLYGEFARRGLGWVPSEANFVVVRLGRDTAEATARMRREGVLVRDGAAVGLPGHLRISIGTRQANQRMLGALDRALNSEGG